MNKLIFICTLISNFRSAHLLDFCSQSWNSFHIKSNNNNNNNNNTNNNNSQKASDIVVVNKYNNKVIIVDIASPWDHRVYEKEGEKIEKSQDLKREI